MDKFIYTFNSHQYEECHKSLQNTIKEIDLYQYLIEHYPDCFLSKNDKEIDIELLLNLSIKSSFGKNVSGEIINVLLFSESGFFAEGYGTNLLDALLSKDLENKTEQSPYEIFIDGAYGILIKNKSNIPLCVLGFDVNEHDILVRQIQGTNNKITNRIHRDINKFIWRKLLMHSIATIAKKLGKNRVFYQKCEKNYRDVVKNNFKGYDDVFKQAGLKEEGEYFVEYI